MALILPGQSSEGGGNLNLPTGGGKLVLPGTKEAQGRADRLGRVRQYALEQRGYNAEASRGTASRFLEELGISGKEIAKSTARSFISAGKMIESGSATEPFLPTTDFEKALVGEKPVSFKTIGEEYAPLLKSIGVSEETTKKLSVPLGMFIGALDIYPGSPGKKQAAEAALRRIAEGVAKTSDEAAIKAILSDTLKASGEIRPTYKGASDFVNKKGIDPDSVIIKDDSRHIVESIDHSGNAEAILTEVPIKSFGKPKFTTLNQKEFKAGRKIEDPIEVYINDGKLQIADGANRFTQAVTNGDETVPVIIKNADGSLPTNEQLRSFGITVGSDDPLLQEARKYKSAEEFVNNGVFYRGEGGGTAQGKGMVGLAKGKFFVLGDEGYAKTFGEVKPYTIRPDAKILDLGNIMEDKVSATELMQRLGVDRPLSPTALRDFLKEKGYDAIRYNGNYTTYGGGKDFTHLIELSDNLFTPTSKSQLTDIWKKANEGGDAIDALSKALVNVSDPEDARKLIDLSLRNGDVISRAPSLTLTKAPAELPIELKRVAKSIEDNRFSKESFLENVRRTIAGEMGDESADNMRKFITKADELGMDPSKFYDAVSSGGSGGLDRIGRSLLGNPPEKRITRTESTILKEKIRNLARGAREGSSTIKRQINEVQDTVIRYATDNLPVSERGSLLRVVRDADSPKRLIESLEKITKKIDQYEALQAVRKEFSTRQQKIGYLKKVGDFSSTLIKDAKLTIGVDKPIREMNTVELDSMIKELGNRLDFKRSHGMLDIPSSPSATKLPEEYLKRFIAQKEPIIDRVAKSVKTKATSFKEGAEDYLGVISTQLGNIHPSLKHALRRFEFNARRIVISDSRTVESLAKKLKNMPIGDFQMLDAAMKNGAIDNVNEIAAKYGFEGELKSVRKMLDDIYARSKEVGLDVEYRRNYIPRQFKNDETSVKGILEYFGRVDGDGVIDKAILEKEEKLGRPLTDVEKVNTINTLLRGFKQGGINLSKTGSLKSRVIDTVTPELNQFYEDSVTSLFNYVEKVNNLIESRKFFGKHLDLKKMTSEDDLTDVIGAYVNNLVAKGEISTVDQLKLRRILEARFSSRQMNQALGALKNVGYITVMGSPLNALTQLGDLGFAFYRAGLKGASGGLVDAIKNFAGHKTLTRADIGIDNVAAEFTNRSKLAQMVTQTFKAVGLDRIDRLGKEAFINGTFRSLQDEAAKSPESLIERLTPIFGKDVDSLVDALKRGETTEDVKYLLFSELLDFQPAALSEVPLKYLEAPNGRIFYALKTYSLKLFDVYRREVIQEMSTNPKKALQNLVRLSSSLMLFNAIASELQDTITGQKTDLNDRTVDTIAKAFGFNRYTFVNIGKEGLGKTFAEQILPPTQLIDDLSKDTVDIAQGDFDPNRARTIRDIPVGGKLYYWWFGRGTGQEKKGKKESGGIPSITIPSVDIPTIKLPSF